MFTNGWEDGQVLQDFCTPLTMVRLTPWAYLLHIVTPAPGARDEHVDDSDQSNTLGFGLQTIGPMEFRRRSMFLPSPSSPFAQPLFCVDEKRDYERSREAA